MPSKSLGMRMQGAGGRKPAPFALLVVQDGAVSSRGVAFSRGQAVAETPSSSHVDGRRYLFLDRRTGFYYDGRGQRAEAPGQ